MKEYGLESMILSKEASARLASLNFACTLLIVMVHCFRLPNGWFSTGICIPDADNLFDMVFQFGFCQGVARLALPFFFLISGFMMVKDYDASLMWWRKVLAKRVFSLYVPFILWNSIAWLWGGVHGGDRYAVTVKSVVETIFGLNLFAPPACVQLWYFRAILIYALAIPVFCLALRRFWLGFGIVLVVWAAGFLRVPSIAMEFAWENICYFFAGVWICLHRNRIASWWATFRFRRLLPISFVIVWFVTVSAGLVHFRQLYNRSFYILIPLGLMTIHATARHIELALRFARPVYGYSLCIFAMHLIMLGLMEQLFKGLGFSNRLSPFLIVTEWASAVLACIFIGFVIKKLLPTFFTLINGGRPFSRAK